MANVNIKTIFGMLFNKIVATALLPYFPVYKSTFQDLKISPKIRPRLIHGSKLEIQAPVK